MYHYALYILNYPAINSLSEGESGSIHERNSLYFSKIENSSYHLELVLHPMPELVEKLSSLVRKTPSTFLWWLLIMHITCGSSVISFCLLNLLPFSSSLMDESSLSMVSLPRQPFPFLCLVHKIFRVLSGLGYECMETKSFSFNYPVRARFTRR